MTRYGFLPGGVPFARSEESVSTIVLPVGLDGILSVPGMPPISVSGLNLSDLQIIIENMVRGNYGSFAVTSGLARSASFEIPVTGQVRQPGITAVNGLTRLSEVIYEAGGATATAAMSNILVVHSNGDSSYYDLNAFTPPWGYGFEPPHEKEHKGACIPIGVHHNPRGRPLIIIRGNSPGGSAAFFYAGFTKDGDRVHS